MRKKLFYLICLIQIVAIPLFSATWYVRPAGGNYGAENGTSYENGWDGLQRVVWGTGGVQPGDTLYVCGTHIYDMAVKAAGNKCVAMISGTDESHRVIIRGDYPGDAGIVWGSAKINYGSWVYEGDNIYSLSNWCGTQSGWENLFFQSISGADGTRLTTATSLANCKSIPGSVYSADYAYNGTIYVHCTDGSNPTGKIYAPVVGWVLYAHQRSYITFLNLTLRANNMIYIDWTCDHIKWQGCDAKYARDELFGLGINAHHIEIIDCTIHYAQNGIYTVSSVEQAAYNCTFRGNTIYDMGIVEGLYSLDAHGIGIQGGHDNLIEGNEIYNCGSGITLYAFTNQTLKDTIIRRNYCHNMHQILANGRGIEFNCDNNSLSDKTGNKAYSNIVANCPDAGFQIMFEDQVELYNNLVYNCGSSFHSARTYDVYGPNVYARNNISLSPTTRHVGFYTGGSINSCDYDYNLYYPDGANLFSGINFSGWQGKNLDTHSPRPADPKFVNTSGDFHLQSSSPAIDKGVDVGLTQDRDGTSIPKGFAPDIGAYEYISGSSPLIATASASPTSGQAPLTVSFNGSATGGSTPYTYNWNFGDGQSSATQNPSHTYGSAGNFTAALTVTDSQSATDIKSVTINVTTPPPPLTATASASPTSGQAPLTVNFTGSATGGTTPYSYSWAFGDEQSSTSQNPSHTYSSAGNYTATLIVTDSKATTDSKSVAITVTSTPPPLVATASANPTSGQAPLPVNFTGSATGGTPPYSYSWNFGDSQSSTSQNPSHTYSSAGSYAATLTVTDSQAKTDSKSVAITVTSTPPPLTASASGNPTSGQAPLSVSFTGSASGGTSPYSYNWNFGDGQSSTTQNPSHTYTTIGNFTATLTVSDSRSSTASATVNITVNTQSTYTLSISSATGAPASGQGGTTDPSPGNHSFSNGSTVQVKSIPNTDYRFSIWTGDISATDLFRTDPTITIDKNKSVSANFCAKCGDVNGDLNITPSDAQRAFDIYLGRIANPTDCEKENADVNSSGTKLDPKITPADAQAIFNKYLKKGELPSDCSGTSRAAALALEKLSLPNLHLILNDVTIVPGEEVIVPVIAESPTNIDAFGFDLSFPRKIFEFVRLERTEYSNNYVQIAANELTPGTLRVGGYRTRAGINSSSAVLVTLIFRVIGNTSEQNSFSIIDSYDDLQSATIRNGLIHWKIGENEGTFRRTAGKRIDD